MCQLADAARISKVYWISIVLLMLGWFDGHLADAANRYVRKTIVRRTVPTQSVSPTKSSMIPGSSMVRYRSATSSSVPIQGETDARTILIWISGRTPDGVSRQRWRESILLACQAWFARAGCTVQTVANRSRAEIVFDVASLGRNIMGQSRIPGALVFPRVPVRSSKARVFVNRSILSLGHRDLVRTLKHEVGHVLGLPHDSRSVVGRYHSDLTIHDQRMIERYRSHLNRRWPVVHRP